MLSIQLSAALDSVRVQQQPLSWLILLWIIRAREHLPPGTRLLIKSEPACETSHPSEDRTRVQTDDLIRLVFEDDGPDLSTEFRAQLASSTADPPGTPELFLYWLLGSVLREYHATASAQTLTKGTQITVLWPKAAPPVRP